jgi:heme-binding HmuY-like protein
MRIASLLLLVAAFLLPRSAEAQSASDIYVGDGLVYYNLRSNEIVPDSARTKTNWDIMINGVEIHANRAGLILEEDFDSVDEAPLEGMSPGIMTTESDDSWYNYDMNTHIITPLPDRTFVLQLADDTYAKMEIQSYNHRISDDPRYVSFRFVLQPDGSLIF